MTDNSDLWDWLGKAGRNGVHSFDVRHRLSGNPSQRIIELEELHACSIPRRREKRGRRWGVRYFHPNQAPAGVGGPTEAGPRAAGAVDPDWDPDQVFVLYLNYADPERPYEDLRWVPRVDEIPDVTEAEARAIFASHGGLAAAA